MNINWQNGFKITFTIENKQGKLSANKAGLISLANQLLDLAQENNGCHIHYDINNSLEDNSSELIIEKHD